MIIPEVDLSGSQFWYKDGKRHRIGGPATIYSSGSQFWHKDGGLHRVGGPAAISQSGVRFWYEDDVHYDPS